MDLGIIGNPMIRSRAPSKPTTCVSDPTAVAALPPPLESAGIVHVTIVGAASSGAASPSAMAGIVSSPAKGGGGSNHSINSAGGT